MIKLSRYLKPYLTILLLIIILLFIQAFCDLSLPNYMSDIINVGLQKNGIENSRPEVISKNAFTLITSFMTEEQKEFVNKHYKLIQTNIHNSDYNENVSKYKLLETEDIYILDTEIDGDLEKLNIIFEETSYTFVNMLQKIAQSNGVSDTNSMNMESVDFSAIYELIPVIMNMPAEFIEDARTQTNEIPEMLRQQVAVTFTKAYYQEVGVDIGELQNKYIIKTGLIMLLIVLIGGTITVVVSFFSSRIASKVAEKLRTDIFTKVQNFSTSEFRKFGAASLITRTTSDVTQLQTVLGMGIRMIIYAPIMAIGGIVMALGKSSSMSWILVLVFISLVGLMLTMFSVSMPKFKKIQKLVDKLNLISREKLSGIMVSRAFGNEEFDNDRFDQANKDLTSVSLFVNRLMAFAMPIMMFIMNGTTLLVVWVGSHQIAESTMQIGDMLAFMQYSMQIIMSFLFVSMMLMMLPRASTSANRISEVLETKNSVKDVENPKHFNKEQKTMIEFKDVTFRYENADGNVLENISFLAQPGKITAFIGSTGSGKSTLINLIPRFFDVTEGEILINDINIKEFPQKELHDQIGYIPQKGVLFKGTIASNLRYGKRDATDEDIKISAEVAQATEFIMEKEDNFDSEISQGGTNVSGGQRQRLSIARALVKKPSIYIFDDSFSALDFKTDFNLRAALNKYTNNSTILIVAQRVNTIKNADQIIVLDEGKLVGKGTHKELLKNCNQYHEIASSQLSKEELENE